ncbi:sorting nexin 2A-like [Phalaenopsis equestris]|uniref:sorting nexin 2A-like n=1 Tax=Phalaenopsis equestris TaxID=78828 RepID=UPI0009E65151|nr:sorting nexin 2A-like [Phalaenopsis equestris]
MMDPGMNRFGFAPVSLREEMETLPLADGPIAAVPADENGAGDPLLHPLQPNSPFSFSSPPPTSSFPDPPAYLEGVSLEATDPIKGAISPSHRRKSREDSDYLNITVSDPQKESESTVSLVPGAGTFVSYLITTRTCAADISGSPLEFSVRRRFRDVVTLADRIGESYRGFVIPPRPDKSVVESQVMQKHEFVEQRRSALEKYLSKLAEHPVIGKSDELRVFLEANGKFPLPATADMASRVLDGAVRLPKQLFSSGEAGSGYVAAPQDVVQPAKGGRDLLRMFKELKQSVSNDWGGAKPSLVEEDKTFLERKERVLELEQQLSTASQQAEALVKAHQDISETMGELGLAFLKLGKFESEEAVCDSQRIRAADFKHLATAAVRASRAYRESNSLTMKHLEKLHEYYGLMLAVHHAFSDRSSALVTLQTLLSDLSSLSLREEKLKAASSKIFGSEKTRTRKLDELKETIIITEDAKSIAFREYERIKQNNNSELDRLDKERREDFFAMIKGYIVNQAGYAEKIAGIWTQVAGETDRYANGAD